MALLTRTALQELGIEMTDEDFILLDEHFETTLRDRVMAEVAAELDETQTQQLIAMQGVSDEELMTWLRTNIPELSEIVSDEVDILLGEIAEQSDAFVSRPPAPPETPTNP